MGDTNLQQYFEPIVNLNEREYPISQDELADIVEKAMTGLDIVAERVRNMRSQLSPEEQARADSFLFYVDTLREHNVSPISLDIYQDKANKRIIIKRHYVSDISFKGGIGWSGLMHNGIPTLEWNNLRSYFFLDAPFFMKVGKQFFEKMLLETIMEQHRDILSERFRNGVLVKGDTHFGWSQYKSYLEHIDKWFKYSNISKKPTEEELEKAKAELDDKNCLAYIDLQGREVRPNKTTYEAWDEFRTENTQLFQRLVELCNPPDEQRAPLRNELYRLVDRAFVLLRIKGFNKYPHLSV